MRQYLLYFALGLLAAWMLSGHIRLYLDSKRCKAQGYHGYYKGKCFTFGPEPRRGFE